MILDCVTRCPLVISEQGFLTPKRARVTSVLILESVSKAKSQEPKNSIGQKIKWDYGRGDGYGWSPHWVLYPVPSSQQAGGGVCSLSHPCDLGFGGRVRSEVNEFLDVSRTGN